MMRLMSLWFLPAVVWLCMPRITSAGVPSTAHIGGLFAPMTPSGHLDLAQAEHLAAFVMAVNDINNKNDGIYDNLLLGTELVHTIEGDSPLIGAIEQFFQLIQSFDGSRLFSVISALDNEDMLVIAQLASKVETQIMTTVSDSGEYYDPSWWPTVSNIAALQSHEGAAIQNHICQFATKVLLFVGTDADDIDAMSEFTDESVCTLHIFSSVVIRSEDSDFTSEIAHAKSFGARVFIFFLHARQVAALLEQGYAAGLFHEGITISLSSRGTTNITQHFSTDADISSLMMATFSYHYYPEYFMNKTAESISFAGRWRKQKRTAGILVDGEMVCDAELDGDGDHYLYKAVDPITNHTICTGLNFTEYDELGFGIQPNTGLTYDATIMAAMALDFAIRNGLDYNDYTVIQDILVNNVSLAGVTGPLVLSKGFPHYRHAGRNTRSGGTIFRLTNFNPTMYSDGYTSPEDFMVPVGFFDTYTQTFVSCGAFGPDCFPAVYSSASDGSQYIPPPDYNPTISVKLPTAYSTIFHVMAGILFFMVFAFGVFVVVNRRSKVIKASQPTLLACILIGGLLGAVRISVGGTDKNDTLCATEFWIGHLAFIIMIGSLFVKSYRVHRIVNTKGLRRVTFTAFEAFKILLGIVAAAIIYLIIASIVGDPDMHYLRSFKANQETHWKYCSMDYSQFQTALFALEFIFLITGFRICWEIRNVPDLVNESKQISTAMSAILLVSVLIMPIIYFLGLPPDTTELIASLGFGFGAIVTLLLLFVPKVALVYGIGITIPRLSAKISPGSTKEKKGAQEVDHLTATIDDELERCLKGRSKEEKLIICQDRLRRWQALLLDQQRALMNSTSSNVRDGGKSEASVGPARDSLSAPLSVEVLDIVTKPGTSLFTVSSTLSGERLYVEDSQHGLEVQDI
jgi:hypothetical protein